MAAAPPQDSQLLTCHRLLDPTAIRGLEYDPFALDAISAKAIAQREQASVDHVSRRLHEAPASHFEFRMLNPPAPGGEPDQFPSARSSTQVD